MIFFFYKVNRVFDRMLRAEFNFISEGLGDAYKQLEIRIVGKGGDTTGILRQISQN